MILVVVIRVMWYAARQQQVPQRPNKQRDPSNTHGVLFPLVLGLSTRM